MAIWRFENNFPQIADTTYVANSADVIGSVKIGENCYIGPGARLRGDYGRITIGDGTSIQENVVIHARPEGNTIIGNNVTIGHGAIIHNSELRDNSVIGMGAIASDFSILKEWAILGEGGLAPRNFILEEGEIGVGIPAKVVGNINQNDALKDELWRFKLEYQEMAARHLQNGALEKIRD